MTRAYSERNPFATVDPLTGIVTAVWGANPAAMECVIDKPYPFGEAPVVTPPTEPEIIALGGTKVSATEYDDVVWSATVAPWLEPNSGGATFYPRMDIDKPSASAASFGWPDGYPIAIHLPPSGSTYKIAGGGSVAVNVKTPCLTEEGHIVISAMAPHPALTPAASLDAWGELVQFIRSICPALGADPTKIYAVPRSRGNYINVTCLRPDLADSSSTSYRARQSSVLPLVMGANTQAWYNARRAAEENIDDMADAAAFYAGINETPNEAMPSFADMVATAPQVHTLVTNYDFRFPSDQYGTRKVDYALITTNHWPGSGESLMDEYGKRGMASRIVCWDNSQAGGDAEQLGYYPRAASEFFRGATIGDAMMTSVAIKKSLAAYALRPAFRGAYQGSDGTNFATPVTAVGQKLGGVINFAAGIAASETVAPAPTKSGGSPTAGNRTTVTAVANGYAQRALAGAEGFISPQSGSGGTADRPVLWWTDTEELTTADQYPASGIRFGATTHFNVDIVAMVTGVQGATIDAQSAKVFRFAAKHRAARRPLDWKY